MAEKKSSHRLDPTIASEIKSQKDVSLRRIAREAGVDEHAVRRAFGSTTKGLGIEKFELVCSAINRIMGWNKLLGELHHNPKSLPENVRSRIPGRGNNGSSAVPSGHRKPDDEYAEELIRNHRMVVRRNWNTRWASCQSDSKPPLVVSRGIHVLREAHHPENFLHPEYFRSQGRNREINLSHWVALERNELMQREVKLEEDAISASRLVITTDGGIGKTTEMQWLEYAMSDDDSAEVAFYLQFSEYPDQEKDLLSFLASRLERSSPAAARDFSLTVETLERLRDEGRIVLLVDALDQVPPDSLIVNGLRDCLEDVQWDKCRIVIGGRPYALARYWEQLFSRRRNTKWLFIRLDEFTKDEQRLFLGTTNDGVDRLGLIPTEACEILPTPRVLEFLRELPDETLREIRTESDVYWRSTQYLLEKGIANSHKARMIGQGGNLQLASNVQRASIERATQLLAVIAFEMVVNQNASVEGSSCSGSIPNFNGVHRGEFRRFRHFLLVRLNEIEPAQASELENDLEGVDALNSFLSQSFFDTVDGLCEIFWRNRTLQEFFAAVWLAQFSGPQDLDFIAEWIYVPTIPRTDAYYWVWRFLTEMDSSVVDPTCWTRAVQTLFRPGDGSLNGTQRSTEFIYRAWRKLSLFAERKHALSERVLNSFLGEFETQILSGQRGAGPQSIAKEFCESFVAIPSGSFQMGTPKHKQGMPSFLTEETEDFLLGIEDPEAKARKELGHVTYGWGKNGNDEFQQQVKQLAQIFRDKDFESYCARDYPKNETPENRKQFVKEFLISKWPTINTWFRLFSPTHGHGSSQVSTEINEFSPKDQSPVIHVSWYDAWVFCKWARWNSQSCRLPMEYEWEYAAKAGTQWNLNYWWGGEWDSNKCHAESSIGTLPPSENRSNPWGIVDMSGNVWEWTNDRYRNRYDRDKSPDASTLVLRGGSWRYGRWDTRSCRRNHGHPSVTAVNTGFRVARGSDDG
ncbi:MAG: SUMF1/EgtB/PvdO family nonheme iron enzyme [Planctomycetales bacterium]|nr:SUMF1/EgtB/PvdO family nonheme iron enzyme [Planctomycetales bacterium]